MLQGYGDASWRNPSTLQMNVRSADEECLGAQEAIPLSVWALI